MADFRMRIELQEAGAQFVPGCMIRGQVVIEPVQSGTEVKSAELLLFWRTSGIGTRDEGVAETVALVAEGQTLPTHFSRDFQFIVPNHPLTYHGKLIKIDWYLGLYVKKSWVSSQELELPLEIRRAVDTPAKEKPAQPEYFYDAFGRQQDPPEPLNI